VNSETLHCLTYIEIEFISSLSARLKTNPPIKKMMGLPSVPDDMLIRGEQLKISTS
jgi:hypothetical protein